jgi:hypothetical protein
MTTAAGRAHDDDDQLPELAPLDSDEGRVEVPDEIIADALERGLDDDEVAGVDPRAAMVMAFLDDGAGEDDEGTPDDPIDALPEDERGHWVGDDERTTGDDVAEIDEPARDHPDGGEDGPTRDPYDEVDTALPALDDGDDDEGPDEAPSP